MKYENKANKILEDLIKRNENWDKLDGVPEKVVELDESRLLLKNEIENGEFRNGTVGWIVGFSTATIYISDGNLLITGRSSGYGFTDVRTPISFNDDVYYMRGRVRVLDESSRIRFMIDDASSYVDKSNPTLNEWYELSLLGTKNTNGSVVFRTFSDDPTDKKTEVEHMLAINLTQIFGAGNEPTKEEMDIIMDTIGYFNGTHKITSKEQFNILLKMVRENALATTSLGGGF